MEGNQTAAENCTTTVSYYATQTFEEEEYESWGTVTFAVLLVVFIIIGLTNIIGNTCTLIAYISDAKLRKISNYYICNLAITDLIIGLISVPSYSVYTLKYFRWPFGKIVCKLFLTLDFLVCAVSSFNIILISLDRMLMVKLALKYPMYVTSKRTIAVICGSWILGFLMYGPAIIGADIWRGYSTVEEGDCDVEFAEIFLYVLIASLFEFCVPFVLVSTFNFLLYMDIHKRNKNLASLGITIQSDSRLQKLNSDRKTAKNLFILVITFFICWTPYTVTTIFMSICGIGCVNETMYELLNWLLWVNSSLNPYLYAYSNVRFRDHFKRYLCAIHRKTCYTVAQMRNIYTVKNDVTTDSVT